MNKLAIVFAGIMTGGLAQADNLEGVKEMLCAVSQVQICIENDTCYSALPAALNIPDFVIINPGKKTLTTTEASNQNRSTSFSSVEREGGLIYLQGIENGRAFSFVIEETSGRMTVAVSRDGIAVSVFGACTDTNL